MRTGIPLGLSTWVDCASITYITTTTTSNNSIKTTIACWKPTTSTIFTCTSLLIRIDSIRHFKQYFMVSSTFSLQFHHRRGSHFVSLPAHQKRLLTLEPEYVDWLQQCFILRSNNWLFYRHENEQLKEQGLKFTNILTQVRFLQCWLHFRHHSFVYDPFLILLRPALITFSPCHMSACIMVARVAPPDSQVSLSFELILDGLFAWCIFSVNACDKLAQFVCGTFLPRAARLQFPGYESEENLCCFLVFLQLAVIDSPRM